MKYDGYIFDFDGTLADSGPCNALATQKAFVEQGLNKPTVEEVFEYMGVPIEISFPKMANKELTTSEIEELFQVFRGYIKIFENKINLFPEVERILQELKSQDKKLFVLSSKKHEVLVRQLENLAIAQYFDEILGADSVAEYKPHPAGIDKIVDQYHFSKEKVLMIGDATHDVEMANAAGVDSFALTYGAHGKEKLLTANPVYICDDMLELLAII